MKVTLYINLCLGAKDFLRYLSEKQGTQMNSLESAEEIPKFIDFFKVRGHPCHNVNFCSMLYSSLGKNLFTLLKIWKKNCLLKFLPVTHEYSRVIYYCLLKTLPPHICYSIFKRLILI